MSAERVMVRWGGSKGSEDLEAGPRTQSCSKDNGGAPVVAQGSTNPTRNDEVVGSIPGLAQRVKDPALL